MVILNELPFYTPFLMGMIVVSKQESRQALGWAFGGWRKVGRALGPLLRETCSQTAPRNHRTSKNCQDSGLGLDTGYQYCM